ncbi:type IV secretory system conjugative DNA transfer family protein, partial [Modestobacter sp. KNN46-3]|uniref:type IV secretory system conjugative DNA transfer family protein n=1 Tax=Modestobacter sp. KNN46-3 TaxID=2711218 RepID=UPI0013E07292
MESPVKTAAMVWRSGVFPVLAWVTTLLGGAFLLGVMAPSVPGSADRWITAGIAWLVLIVYTGPSVGRNGERPLPGAGPRGYVWLGVCGLLTLYALVKAGLTAGQVLASLALLAGIGGVQYLRVWRQARQAADEESGNGYGRAAVAVTGAGMLISKGGDFVGAVVLFIGVLVFASAQSAQSALGLSWPVILVVVVAGMVLGRRLVVWFPPGFGRQRADQAHRMTMRDHIEAARNGGGSRRREAAAAESGTAGSGVGARSDGLAELGDVPGAFRWLSRQGVPTAKGIFTGRVEYPDGSLGDWATANPHLLGIGAPGSGKSSTILGQNLMAHMGIVIASSSKGDLAEQTAAWRSLLGETLFWDPTGKSLTPAHCTPLRWSPVMGIYTRDDAVWAAKQLVDASAVQGGAGSDSAEHFRQRATLVLAPLLYAGMLAGKKISKVVEWVEVGPSGEGWKEPLELLATDGQDRFVRQLTAFIEQSEGDGGRENHSVLTTVGNLFSPYATDRALREADDADFDPQSWLRTHWGWGTVYVVTTAGSEAKAVGPLVALMM